MEAHHSGRAEDRREGLPCRGERVDITVSDGGHGDQRKVARGGDVLELGARPVVRRQLRLPIPNLRKHKHQSQTCQPNLTRDQRRERPRADQARNVKASQAQAEAKLLVWGVFDDLRVTSGHQRGFQNG